MLPQGSKRIRVLVAEDNLDLCDAVCSLLGAEPDMEVVGAVSRARGLVEAVREGRARVVVLDLDLSGESSVGALHVMRREMPSVGVVVFSGYDKCDMREALPDGDSFEYVSKTDEAAHLVDAIRRVANEAADAGS